MGPAERAAAEGACDELMAAWAEMIRIRDRVMTEREPRYLDARKRTVDAMRNALAAGLTWRLIGEAIGTSHASAYAWWRRWGDRAEGAPPAQTRRSWKPMTVSVEQVES